MATGRGPQAVASFSEVVLAQAFKQDALLKVLERKGDLTKAEVLGEIQRLREKAAKAH